MKPPAKNMATDLRGMPKMADGVSVQKQTPQSTAGMTIPGEGGLTMSPGEPNPRSGTMEGIAVGRIFGGSGG